MDTKKLVILIPSNLHKEFKTMCVDLEKTMASIINEKISVDIEIIRKTAPSRSNLIFL